jgi:RPA family protein
MRFDIMTNRELAWRVFAGEYNSATIQLDPAREREPGYIITPLGAKINRVYMVGVLTDIEKLDRNGGVHYRARVSDRTGVFYIYAGQYDPKVIKVLSTLEPPAYVAVIGKSRMYSPTEDKIFVSIRPENLIVVDKNARDYWLLDACKSLKTRLDAFMEAQGMDPPEKDKLIQLGFDPAVAEGLLTAMEHYKQPDLMQYRNMLVDVLKFLVVDNGESYITTENGYSKNLKDLTAEFKTAEEISEAGESNPDSEQQTDELDIEPHTKPLDNTDPAELEEKTEKLLDIIRAFKGKKYKDGVPWGELVVKAHSDGIDKNIVEDLVNGLLDTGRIYEPILGRIRCTSN